MQDEVLCHRLGLLPLKIDPRKVIYNSESLVAHNDRSLGNCDVCILHRGCADAVSCAEDPDKPQENDTLIFDLRVQCDRRPDAARDETDPRKRYYDSDVYSGQLTTSLPFLKARLTPSDRHAAMETAR